MFCGSDFTPSGCKNVIILVLFTLLLAVHGTAIVEGQEENSGFQLELIESPETVEGAVFPLPKSLEADVDRYRERIPGDLAPFAFVLANSDSTYIVFDDERPDAGKATVTGARFERGISVRGFDFGVISARSVSVETTGRRSSVSEINSNPENYELELVRINANHRRLSIINDPDQGQNITAPVSIGALTVNPTTADDIFSQPVSKGRSLAINTSTDQLGSSSDQEINALLGSNQDRLITFDFETRYWSDREESVDGIVLAPGSQARKFATTFDETGVLSAGSGEPILYVVGDSQSSETYSSVSSLTQNANVGDIVSVEASFYGQSISTQETLEQNTPCGQSSAQVPTPSGPVCIDLLQDVVIDAGVAWSSDQYDSTIFIMGLSSNHLDDPMSEITGEYTIIGKIIPSSKFDPSLPERQMLVVYELRRTGDIQYNQISAEPRDNIEKSFQGLNMSIQNQNRISASSSPQTQATTRTTTRSDISGEKESSDNVTQNNDSLLFERIVILSLAVLGITSVYAILREIAMGGDFDGFVISLSCRNCGNEWDWRADKGHRVKNIDSGVGVKPENEEPFYLHCPNCEVTDDVNVESRDPN